MIGIGGLMKNEFLKFRRKKKFIIVLIVLAVLTFFSVLLTWYGDKQDTPENKVKSYQSAVDYYKGQLDKKSVSNDEKKSMNSKIAQYQMLLDQAKQEKEGDSDWKQAAKDKIELYKKQKKDPEVSLDSSQVETLNYQIKEQQYYINNNIKPEKSGTFSAIKGLIDVIYLVDFLFVAVIVAALSGDIVSGECTPPTMKILLTKPVSRAKILFSKFLAAISASVGSVLAVELLAFLITGIIFGFGSPSQPVGFGTKYVNDAAKIALAGKGVKAVLGSTVVLTTGKFVLLMLLFQILFITACASFSFMISSITKSSAASLIISIISIVVMFIGTMIATMSGKGSPWLFKILACFFTSYNDTANLLGGGIAQKFFAPFVTPVFGAIVMIVWIVVCYVISHIVFTKRDMLV